MSNDEYLADCQGWRFGEENEPSLADPRKPHSFEGWFKRSTQDGHAGNLQGR